MNNFPTVSVLTEVCGGCHIKKLWNLADTAVAERPRATESQKSTVAELPEGPDHFCGGGITLDSSLQLDGEGQEVLVCKTTRIDLAADLKLSSKTVVASVRHARRSFTRQHLQAISAMALLGSSLREIADSVPLVAGCSFAAPCGEWRCTERQPVLHVAYVIYGPTGALNFE